MESLRCTEIQEAEAGVIIENVEQNTDENMVTVLSIDGGGIRGIIPGVILKELEDILKKIDKNEDARVADYFDVVAGTSTGSIIASMLTLPDRFEASKIIKLYDEAGGYIFSKKAKHQAQRAQQKEKKAERKKDKEEINIQAESIFSCQKKKGEPADQNSQKTTRCKFNLTSIFQCVKREEETENSTKKKKIHDCKTLGKSASKWIMNHLCCKYDPSFLRYTVKKNLSDHLLDEIQKDLVVTTFNVKDFRPFIFSTSQARELKQCLQGDGKFPQGIEPRHDLYADLKLSDVILSSTAAPSYFPPHHFHYRSKKHRFIDGGLAANNPSLLALCEAARLHGNKQNYSNYLVLSIGTGRETPLPMRICDEDKPGMCWPLNRITCLKPTEGSIEWFCTSCFAQNRMPRFVESVLNSQSDMVEIYMSLIFQGQGRNNYLRIQEYQLEEEEASIDDASQNNLKNLSIVGHRLLQKPASNINPDTCLPEEQKKSNQAALVEFAHKLSQARKNKEQRSEAAKQG